MVASNFDAALARVLVHEGGYSNHPKDPGGATMRGIIQKVYDAYRSSKGQPTRSVRQLTDDEMRDIYRRQYWDAIQGDKLPAGIDYVTFDGAVNSGPGQSAKWLQRALGLTADGQVGALTLNAAAYHSNRVALVDRICDQRLAMLKTLRTWPTFGKGWARRVADVRSAGKIMATGFAPPAPAAVPVAVAGEEAGKARPADVSLTSIAKSPEGLSTIATVGGGVVAAASGSTALQWALAALILCGGAVAGWYFVRRVRADAA